MLNVDMLTEYAVKLQTSHPFLKFCPGIVNVLHGLLEISLSPINAVCSISGIVDLFKAQL